MHALVEQIRKIEERLRQGGGPERVARQHKAGKLTAHERIEKLIDPDSFFLEIGLLVAWDLRDGKAPAAGVVTGIGHVSGRPIAIVANDSTVKAGAWWPETVPKIVRMQEVGMHCQVPIVYLVDSSGINLPFQESIFPGQYGGARIFYNNSLMRRRLRIPQITAVMGPCIAGGAYLPAPCSQRRHHHGGKNKLYGAGRAESGQRSHRKVGGRRNFGGRRYTHRGEWCCSPPSP